MSRYTDTKWLEENAKEYSLGYYDYDEYAVPLSALDSAPSIDIVPCRACKWYEDPNHKIFENCVKWKDSHGIILPTKPNDFCSYGERKESE